jgi:hypothetical protein
MTSSSVETKPLARDVSISAGELRISLVDGRRIAVPLTWYPRLAGASEAQLSRWEILGRGEGIRWPELDEDLSVEGIVRGVRPKRSGKGSGS